MAFSKLVSMAAVSSPSLALSSLGPQPRHATAQRPSGTEAKLRRSTLQSPFLVRRLENTDNLLASSGEFSSNKWCMSLRARKNPYVLQPFQDKFLPWLAEAAKDPEGQEQLHAALRGEVDTPPLLDIAAAKMNQFSMAAPAQVERASSYSEHRPKRPPPDLPSLLLHSRIIYIGMPLVPAVTELIIAQTLYLQWQDPRLPIYVYVNSTGTSRADGETVGMETEGFAIYDAFNQVKNPIQTVNVGVAIGQACLILSMGEKGKRYTLPHATAMIQQPKLPSTGQMSAIDVNIRAKELVNNRNTLVKLLARHTGNSYEKVFKCMQRPYYMNPRAAIEFGVVDTVLWRGQESMAQTLSAEEWDKGAGIRVVEKAA